MNQKFVWNDAKTELAPSQVLLIQTVVAKILSVTARSQIKLNTQDKCKCAIMRCFYLLLIFLCVYFRSTIKLAL